MAASAHTMATPPPTVSPPLASDRIACIIKLGGASITVKSSLETINDDEFDDIIRNVVFLYQKTKSLIIVHGAGSFGHFQASDYSIATGGRPGIPETALALGVADTRRAVCSLNQMVVESLIERDVPAVSMSPFHSWITRNRTTIVRDGCAQISDVLSKGLVPVIHGDVVLDEVLQVTILGGDPIMTRLCQYFHPQIAIFATNVDGIFNKPPSSSPDAFLLRTIVVKPSSTSSSSASEFIAWGGRGERLDGGVEYEADGHDVTGGLKAKVDEAVAVLRTGGRGIKVYVVKASSRHVIDIVKGQGEGGELPETWIGTEFLLA